jgi:hypothetical protein
MRSRSRLRSIVRARGLFKPVSGVKLDAYRGGLAMPRSSGGNLRGIVKSGDGLGRYVYPCFGSRVLGIGRADRIFRYVYRRGFSCSGAGRFFVVR